MIPVPVVAVFKRSKIDEIKPLRDEIRFFKTEKNKEVWFFILLNIKKKNIASITEK